MNSLIIIAFWIALHCKWQKNIYKILHCPSSTDNWRRYKDDFQYVPFCVCPLHTGIPTQHSVVGLEAGRWRHLSGGTQTRLHRTELPGARFLHNDGQPVRYEVVQNGESFLTNSTLVLNYRTLFWLLSGARSHPERQNTKINYLTHIPMASHDDTCLIVHTYMQYLYYRMIRI